MKIRLTIILALITVCSRGQAIKLEASNPSPRVGDEIDISFTLEKNNLDSLDILDDFQARYLMKRMNNMGDGFILLSDWFLTEVGTIDIGPIQIPINGKVYITDKLHLTINPKLPNDIRDGVWIRLTNFEGVKYIIFEQRRAKETKYKFDDNGRGTISFTNGEGEWAALNMGKFQQKGIEIIHKGSRYYEQDTSKGETTCLLTVYTLKISEWFKGPLTIGKDLLIYLPDNIHFESAQIEN